MPRTVRLWISDVIVIGTPGAQQRVPAVYLGRRAIAQSGGRPFPAVWAAPSMTGPQIFIGVARMDAADVADTNAALPQGARFRQLEVADTDWDATLPANVRTALNALLTGTNIPALTASDTRRTALRRIARAVDIGIDEVKLRSWLLRRAAVERTD